MGKVWMLVVGITVVCGSTAWAQSGATTNPTGIPDPNAPPRSSNDSPAAAPEEPASAATVEPAAAPKPEPLPPPATPGPAVNVNPAPPSPPPLSSPPDNNAVATSNATVEDSRAGPLPPINADHGSMYIPGKAGLPGFGWAAFVGGGYVDFTNDSMRGITSGGGGWDARLVGGTHSIIGMEAAYVGSARSIDALGLAGNAALISNGFEGALRVNIPIIRAASLLEPFGFVGLGYSRYTVTNYDQAVTSDISSGDGIMTVPLGAGLAYGYRSFMLDARFTYVPTYYNNILASGDRSGTLNTWGVGGNLGVGF